MEEFEWVNLWEHMRKAVHNASVPQSEIGKTILAKAKAHNRLDILAEFFEAVQWAGDESESADAIGDGPVGGEA